MYGPRPTSSTCARPEHWHPTVNRVPNNQPTQPQIFPDGRIWPVHSDMYDEDQVLLVCSGVAVIAAYHLMQRKQRHRIRRCWHTNPLKNCAPNELLGMLKVQEISGQY
ncbi:hypothetical protein PR048_027039 [Dryococelus australis]|uniref:Uncharacterized protein n=1 Tax=Dryococelus australis TaxID=614101 RepID=A0ABQ9GEB3_9NEOP|nr:hypothetical protein PR048_027039 [Dryococelus australis]